ncbi:MAG: hypothetical protein LIO62_06600 [Clostridiales bacterium]|nr:hypothetical protein [Clostridiales bacterium]
MTDDFWNLFLSTGSVQDYLKYKDNEKAENDGDSYKGFSNQRADSGGE